MTMNMPMNVPIFEPNWGSVSPSLAQIVIK